MRTGIATLWVLALAGGCALGPDYEAPEIHSPAEFRLAVPAEQAQSLADLPWWEVFEDPALQRLISRAVEGNYDIRAAAARVRQSSAFVGVARSELLPQVGYDGNGTRQSSVIVPPLPPQTFNLFTGAFNLAWEIDLWGRIRRATEAAEAQLLATEEAQRGILLSLVSSVAEAYFRLIELDAEIEIARSTVVSFEKSLDLFTRRFQGGVGSDLAVARAQASLANVQAQIPALQSEVVATENEISLLLGRNPSEIDRGMKLSEQRTLPVVPAGLPSELLSRRPDLRQAEDQVRAANAEIGVSVANFFPRIGLSSLYGASSTELSDMLNGTFGVWGIAASVSGPIFTGGRNYEQYQLQIAAWEAEVALYEQTVLRAFAEVSSVLTAQHNLLEQRKKVQVEVDALRRSVELSFLRYEIGLANYFEVLQAQQELFPAQIALARVEREQLVSVALLYRVLGGGWELKTEDWQWPRPTPTAAPGS
ncbi:MAG: efflux transporter outer membrane subunit [Candidatus Binatia bacterium]|nr:efflux transporter outer membrane subunit [Candidatus Binatia bacterium]